MRVGLWERRNTKLKRRRCIAIHHGCHIFKGFRPRILTDWPFQTYQTLASEKTTVVHQSPEGGKILSKMMKKMPQQVSALWQTFSKQRWDFNPPIPLVCRD